MVLKTNKKLILTTLFGIILLLNIVFAVPGIPNAFYGSVTYNGQPASDGLFVVVKINGVQVASTTTSGGKYGYPVGSLYVDDPNNDRTGKTINFFVNNVDTGQIAIFQNGGFTKLDLTVTITPTCTCTAWKNTHECAPGKYLYPTSYWIRTCTQHCDIEEKYARTNVCWI